MEPENTKPGDDQAKDGEAEAGDSKVVDAKARESETVDSRVVEVKGVESENSQSKGVHPTMSERRFAQVSRRELLKLVPVLALGAFAVPKFQEGLLKKGPGFSDWASAKLFRRGHMATTFADSELTPFEKFPINGYDVEDPDRKSVV